MLKRHHKDNRLFWILCTSFVLLCGAFVFLGTGYWLSLRSEQKMSDLSQEASFKSLENTYGIENYVEMMPTLSISGLVSTKAWSNIRQAGFDVVIDLRTPSEGAGHDKSLIEDLGMHYINLPVAGIQGLTREVISDFARLYAHYHPESTPSNKTTQPRILIHCVSGNRAGGLWSAYRIHTGIPFDIALSEGRRAGMRAPLEEHIYRLCSKSAC